MDITRLGPVHTGGCINFASDVYIATEQGIQRTES